MYFKSGEFQDQIECVLFTCDVKNTVHASSVWRRTRVHVGCAPKEAKWGDEIGDQEKMEDLREEDELDQGAAQTVQLPQCEADGLLLLCGSSAQDIGERDAWISLQRNLQSTGKWSEAQISNQKRRKQGGGWGKTENSKHKL